MKKLPFFLSLSLILGVFASCNSRLELYADYKDVPVIYGLIDATQDTNYMKIVRAFSGTNDNPIDATQVALIADSNNYPGKLDARIIEYKSSAGGQYTPTGREIMLDTITIHDKHYGVFYAPNQKVYFCTQPFYMDNVSTKYKYKLVVVTPHDTITSETNVVGGDNFKILTTSVTFTPDGEDKTGKISFTPADNAVVYEVSVEFNYQEKKMSGPLVDKQVSWSYGTIHNDDLEYESGHYVVKYNQATLFNALASAIGADTLGVERYFNRNDSFKIHLAAGGRELYNYIQINSPSEGFSQTIPDYTNVNGGFGVFSSRINLNQNVALSAKTCTELIGMKSWGFIQQAKE